MRPGIAPVLGRVARRSVGAIAPRLLRDRAIIFNPYIAGKLFPLQEEAWFSVTEKKTAQPGALPVPPRELWEGYGETVDEYLALGREDVRTMLDLIDASGQPSREARKVLEFGCAAGRMLRFMPRDTPDVELWGVDIKARHIAWCEQAFGPPFAFATTTTAPHLPFEDNAFDLVYCNSVFTHISDLADAWFLELRRVTRAGGLLYLTIHDASSVAALLSKYAGRADYAFLVRDLRRLDREASILSRSFARFTIGVEPKVQVFYDLDYVRQKWGRFAALLSATPEAHGYQTALLFQKPPASGRAQAS